MLLQNHSEAARRIVDIQLLLSGYLEKPVRSALVTEQRCLWEVKFGHAPYENIVLAADCPRH